MTIFATKDADILQAASTLELCTIDDLAEYLSRNKKSLERRLPKLVSAKALYRIRWASTEPFIYSTKDVSRRGAGLIPHELMITAIHTALHRSGVLIGESWLQGKEYWRAKVHQDAFCSLRVGEKTMDLFIEADTGTMNHKDMSEKIVNYLDHFEQNPTPFKVLIVTDSLERARNLSKLAESTVSQKKRRGYLFATIAKFKADPLGEICFIPYEVNPQSILPRLV